METLYSIGMSNRALGVRWLDDLLQDLRYASRTLRRSRGFTVVALVMLTLGLLVVHLWLPAGRRKVFDVIPGVLLTLLLWLAGALIFAYYLATFANYTATYAGLASVMVVLIFLYMVGVIFIIGAELNAALLKFRVRAIFKRNFLSGNGHKRSETDKLPDAGH